MDNRAMVFFTNGFIVSPTIETTRRMLEERILKALDNSSTSPGVCASRFVLASASMKMSVSLLNTPEAPTFGGTMSMLLREEHWPSSGNQAGIFCVDVKKLVCDFWGGGGFIGTPEFTKGIPQRLDLAEEAE